MPEFQATLCQPLTLDLIRAANDRRFRNFRMRDKRTFDFHRTQSMPGNVAEAAVVGFPHEIKGEGICCFVSLKSGEGNEDLKKELIQHVRHTIGALATPDQIRFAAALPKTRSGKIMRRLLRDVAAGRESTSDTSTLEDLNVMAKLRADEDS